MEKKKTVGQAVYENLSKPSETIPVIDLQQSMQKDWPGRIIKQALEDKKYCREKGIQFSYLHIILRHHKHLPNVIDERFISRLTAPAMLPDSTLYRFDHDEERIDLIWSLPPSDVINDVIKNPQNYEDQQEMVLFCQAYARGKFEPITKKRNEKIS
jgi:hypothetical protein